jgi:UDP-N-acetylglucosamine 2-epimerase (non-hydrolysing)
VTASRSRVAIVLGTRPEATKLAPLHLALDRSGVAAPTLIATGQHRDAVDEALEPFDLKPDVVLRVERPSPDLVDLATATQRVVASELVPGRYHAVVVQGDTASTVAGALVAFWRRLPLVHLEAGLRTGDLGAPFPEEGNRRLITPLTALHLAPTERAATNLTAEGVDPSQVVVVGNTSVDAVRHTASRGRLYPSRVPEGFRRHVLVTAHRRESWGPRIRAVSSAVAALAAANPDTAFLVATHMNPAVQRDVRSEVQSAANVRVLPPLPYGEFVRALAGATLTLTDSGGVQEEGSALGVPVLVLRDVTERTEVVDAGGARLVGTDRETIIVAAQHLLDDEVARQAMAAAPCPFGDGLAAERSAIAIGRLLARTAASAPA